MEKTHILELSSHEIELIMKIITKSVQIWAMLTQTDASVISGLMEKIGKANDAQSK
jgi:hypothetical protein